jgi:hypothetical protein
MDFQRVDPGIRGFENHVFECGHCYRMMTIAVKARSLPPGALRSDALKKAGLLRATADRLAESKREAAKPASV